MTHYVNRYNTQLIYVMHVWKTRLSHHKESEKTAKLFISLALTQIQTHSLSVIYPLIIPSFSSLLSRSWSQRQRDLLIRHSSSSAAPSHSSWSGVLPAILESVSLQDVTGRSLCSQSCLEHLQGKAPRGASFSVNVAKQQLLTLESMPGESTISCRRTESRPRVTFRMKINFAVTQPLLVDFPYHIVAVKWCAIL